MPLGNSALQCSSSVTSSSTLHDSWCREEGPAVNWPAVKKCPERGRISHGMCALLSCLAHEPLEEKRFWPSLLLQQEKITVVTATDA